jgi:FkbM family methyltransferase
MNRALAHRVVKEGSYLLRRGNLLPACLHSALLIAGSRHPISVALPPYRLSVRPNTPDLEVARDLADGAFDEAIEAAKPLRHRFIIDAGAYIGTAAIAFARAFPDALIISLEPSNANFKMLCKNTQHLPNVVALNMALGRRVGKATLTNRNTGEWGFTLVQNPTDCPEPQKLHDTMTTTIPQLLRDWSKDGIDLLKLDIEGGERDLLADRPEWVASTRVICAELHDRIQPGCGDAFAAATAGRKNVKLQTERFVLSRQSA